MSWRFQDHEIGAPSTTMAQEGGERKFPPPNRRVIKCLRSQVDDICLRSEMWAVPDAEYSTRFWAASKTLSAHSSLTKADCAPERFPPLSPLRLNKLTVEAPFTVGRCWSHNAVLAAQHEPWQRARTKFTPDVEAKMIWVSFFNVSFQWEVEVQYSRLFDRCLQGCCHHRNAKKVFSASPWLLHPNISTRNEPREAPIENPSKIGDFEILLEWNMQAGRGVEWDIQVFILRQMELCWAKTEGTLYRLKCPNSCPEKENGPGAQLQIQHISQDLLSCTFRLDSLPLKNVQQLRFSQRNFQPLYLQNFSTPVRFRRNAIPSQQTAHRHPFSGLSELGWAPLAIKT